MPSAEQFDRWYADMVASPVRDELVRRHLGLPAHVPSSSLLTWDAIAEVGATLRLSPGRVLLDLACGRGGYGLEVAHQSGAQLIGVDFSGEAVRRARQLAERLGRAAVFQVGDLTATGLTDASVDAVMCVDAVQFARPSHVVYEEIRRVLTPGGRVVLTCWEPVDPSDDRLLDRLRAVDLRAGLTAAGFVDVSVQDRPDWQTVERGLWREAAMLDPGEDPALRALHDEGGQVLQYGHLSRRVMATATAA